MQKVAPSLTPGATRWRNFLGVSIFQVNILTPKKVTPPKNVGGNNQLAGKPRTLGRGTGPKGKVMTPPVKRKARATRTARGRGSARRGRGGI